MSALAEMGDAVLELLWREGIDPTFKAMIESIACDAEKPN